MIPERLTGGVVWRVLVLSPMSDLVELQAREELAGQVVGSLR